MPFDFPRDFIAAPDTAQLRLEFDTPGGKAQNVLTFRKSTPWDSGNLADLITDAASAWESQFSPLQSDQVALSRFIATDLSAPDSWQVEVSPTTPIEGGRASPCMPMNVTVVTKFSTGLTGRSHRGRSYHVGLTDDQCVGDELVAGMADSIRDAWIDFIGEIHDGSTGADHVVVSYCFNKEWRDVAAVTDISNYSTENTLDSQRNRLKGRGI